MKLSKIIQNPRLQRITASLLTTVGILLLGISFHKTVYLNLNGDLQKVETWAMTVGGFLEIQDLDLAEEDRFSPALGKLLWGNEIIHVVFANQIQIEIDDRTIELITAEKNPSNVLLEADLLLYPQDRVFIDGVRADQESLLSPGNDYRIQLLRATRVILISDDGNRDFYTDGPTLAEAFQQEKIEIFEGDDLSYPLDTVLDGNPLTVRLTRATPIMVRLGDETITIRSTAKTIGPALAGAGLALQGLDYSNPGENEPIPENRQVQVIRVREEILLNQEQISFSSEYQPVDDLELDQIQILKGGEYGLSGQRVRIRYEDDQEVSRELEKEWIIKEPIPRTIGYGTKINLQTIDTPNGPITYWRKITAYATSYNPTCPGCDNWTSSGTVLKKGTVAVTLEWYRYMKFSRLYIPGYGFGRIEDVGAGVPWSTNWVDLGYKEDDYVPWSQNVEVYFLAPAPPPDQIMYILY
jgi:uncharacterized protein YabE (DUF348 family)